MSNFFLFCDDCLSVLNDIEMDSIDLIVTDPPYKMTSRGGTGTTGGMLKKKIVNSGKVFKYNNIDCKEYAKDFYRVLKDGGHCYIMTNNLNLIHMLNTFTNAGFHFIKSLIWDKQRKITGTYYMSQYEYILFFRKGKGVKINNCGTSDIISVKNQKTKKNGSNLHDTEKPVELMRILIENSSKTNDIILDPFMGIGSTGVACVSSNRQFIGVEIDKEYYDIAYERIQEATHNV